MRNYLAAAAIVGFTLSSGLAIAAPVNGTGNVTPDVIFGDGNANGSFTGVNNNGIEIALRGKLRFNLGGFPENTFNYDNDKTYTFDSALGGNSANRSMFNFEYSVNTDANASASTNLVLGDLTYLLEFDIDPTAGTNFLGFDPITGVNALTDNATGNNGTANGDGADDSGTYADRLLTDNVAQNSQNLGFGFALDPDLPGIYTFNFSALDGNQVLATTSIDIIVTAQAVPEPGMLSLFGSSLLLMGFLGRRARRKQIS